MCGFVATAGERLEPTRLQQALQRLVHRGPDAGGHWREMGGLAWLGHRRLSIVDPSPAGNQPLTNEDDRLHLVCNGEIYNAPALRRQLQQLGHRFRSRSDNEVILHAYEAWGDACLEHLEGMFAFVLWDHRLRRLLAARDRLGIKPLHYELRPGGIRLASDASALLELDPAGHVPDPTALAYTMTMGYIPAPWSVWRGIRKLEAGHWLTWEPVKGLATGRYWEPPRTIGEADPTPWAERFEAVLREHLLADVPMGLFLSAGLDSTAVAVGLTTLGQPLGTFTVAFPNSPRDESPDAAACAHHLGLPHQAVSLSPGELEPLIDTALENFDEPQTFSSLLPYHLISQAAARQFKAVLAGDGGDEIFGGYSWYEGLNPLPWRAAWQRRLLRPLVRRNAPPALRQRAAMYFAHSSPLHRHAWRLFPRFLPEEVEALLAPMGLRFDDEAALAPFRRHWEPQLPLKRALQRVDLMTFSADYNLTKVDRASMAHGLEVRVPLLDRRLVEWALRRPEAPGAPVKGVLRDYLAGRVPAAILSRPKQGFSARFLDGLDRTEALAAIQRGVWVREGLWDPQWQRLVAPGVPYREARIWVLYALSRWGDIWLDRTR